MIVLKENEHLYPANWPYNGAKILTKLATIVEDNGGRVKPEKKAIITNRTLESAIRDCEDRIERYSKVNEYSPTEARTAAIKELSDRLDFLKQVGNDPITVTHTSYINFVLDETYYSYWLDDNPFFDFFYIKTPVVENKYNANVYAIKDDKEWHDECFIRLGCSDADIVEAAYLIFNKLTSSRYSYKHSRKLYKKIEF